MSLFNTIISTPITNLVVGFYNLFGNNLGLAIIFFTIFLRFVLLPLTIRQIRLQRKMAELQPRLQELQSKRKDASQITPEEIALMRQTTGSCLGGCLPLLIQIPILFSLNHVISQIATSGTNGSIFNDILYFDFLKQDSPFNTYFLGFDLAGVPSKIGWGTQFIPYGILLALLIVTQFIQGRLMNFYQKKKVDKEKNKKSKANERKMSKEEAEKKKMQEDLQKFTQFQTTYLIPILIGVVSFSFNAALSLYWLVQNLFAIAQMHIQNKMIDNHYSSVMDFFKKEKSYKNEKVKEVRYEDVKEESEVEPKKSNKVINRKNSKKKNKKKKK